MTERQPIDEMKLGFDIQATQLIIKEGEWGREIVSMVLQYIESGYMGYEGAMLLLHDVMNPKEE